MAESASRRWHHAKSAFRALGFKEFQTNTSEVGNNYITGIGHLLRIQLAAEMYMTRVLTEMS